MKVSFITLAYNAQKYIDETAQSVLNQTMRDIEWIVCDNGCTDKTGEILAEYASRDSRVTLVRNKDNFVVKPDGEYTITCWTDLLAYCHGEYFAQLDADDTYDLSFAQTMYSFAKTHDADVAVCGTAMFRDNEPDKRWLRVPPLYNKPNPAYIGDDFAKFYGSFRPVWQKLVRTRTHMENREFLTEKPNNMINGVDTFYVLRLLRSAKRVVCFDKPLHFYRLHADSAYYSQLYADRWRSYDILYHEGVALLEKWGKATAENLKFLSDVYYSSMMDLLDVAQRAVNTPIAEKLEYLRNIIASPLLQNQKDAYSAQQKTELTRRLIFIAKQIDGITAEALFGLLAIADRFSPADAEIRALLNQIHGSDDQRLAFCLCMGERYPAQRASLLPALQSLLQKDRLLALLIKSEELFSFPEVVKAVHTKQYETAINLASLLFDRQDFGPKLALARFMESVAAVAQMPDAFVSFVKANIKAAVDSGEWAEAEEKFRDLREMTPNDPELPALERSLSIHSVSESAAPGIAVFGLGFVGLTTALGFAHFGYRVYGVDVDETRKSAIRQGRLPFLETGLDTALQAYGGKNFTVAEDAAEAVRNSDILFFCVGTPYGQDGAADLQYLFSAMDAALAVPKGNTPRLLVIKSTVPPGTTLQRVVPYLEQKGLQVGKDVLLANNPEFLREGHCWEDFIHADRIVVGCDEDSSVEKLQELYKPFGIPFFSVSYTNGEFIKYLSNTLLATLISYSNEMALLAQAIGGIDIRQAFELLHMDNRWNHCSMTSYVYPGCGYGGYCLPKDTKALLAVSKQNGAPAHILEEVIALNERMPEVIAAQIMEKTPKGGTVGILGLSFKPGSNDVRDCVSAKVIDCLIRGGYTHILAYDPVAIDEFKAHYTFNADIGFVQEPNMLVRQSDVSVILTAWEIFKPLKMQFPEKVLDFRHM